MPNAANCKVALYTSVSSLPGNLVANSQSGPITVTANSWNTWTFSTNPTVTNAVYWVGIRVSAHPLDILGFEGATFVACKYQGLSDASAWPATATPLTINNYVTGVYITVQH